MLGSRGALVAAAATLIASSAPDVPQDAFDRGRALTAQLREGRLTELREALSPKFVAAIGGAEGLTAIAGRLQAQLGAEQEVLEEHAYREGGYTTYYRVSRFAKMPSATTRWVWDRDGAVISGTVQPTQKPAATQHLDYRTKAALHLPFGKADEGLWYVAWGGRDPIRNYHVQAPDQRFAYDFLVMRDGLHHRGAGDRNEDHYCWGQPVLAPATGTVIAATDGEPDNARPGVKTAKTPPGNHVVVDHGGGERSLIAHLRAGSVTVKTGQRVRQGELLGVCGNSGTSELPHVHYHLQTGTAYRQGVGLPAFFNGYFTGGRFVGRGEPQRGELLTPR